jgi:serine/threonine protein kinase
VPRTLGILYPLASYGCLMTFLQHPPPGLVPKGGGGTASSSVPSRVKLSLMLDVCQGLEHLHLHGVVHGRLHSRNVLVGGGFRAQLVDFGVSHLISAACATGASRVNVVMLM